MKIRSGRKAWIPLVVGLALTAVSAPARADIVSTFDASGEGWSVVSFTNLTTNDFTVLSTTSPTFHATGGNPGGFISTLDPDNGDFTFSAPTKFLGNVSTATGLSYDLAYPQGAINYQTTDVMLVGTNGERLLYRSIPDIVPTVAFSTISLGFTPSASWRVGDSGGPLATAADFQAVLGDLAGLFIRGEYSTGLVEVPELDNVRLAGANAVPEPSSLVLLSGSLPALLLAWRCRKTRPA